MPFCKNAYVYAKYYYYTVFDILYQQPCRQLMNRFFKIIEIRTDLIMFPFFRLHEPWISKQSFTVDHQCKSHFLSPPLIRYGTFFLICPNHFIQFLCSVSVTSGFRINFNRFSGKVDFSLTDDLTIL